MNQLQRNGVHNIIPWDVSPIYRTTPLQSSLFPKTG